MGAEDGLRTAGLGIHVKGQITTGRRKLGGFDGKSLRLTLIAPKPLRQDTGGKDAGVFGVNRTPGVTGAAGANGSGVR